MVSTGSMMMILPISHHTRTIKLDGTNQLSTILFATKKGNEHIRCKTQAETTPRAAQMREEKKMNINGQHLMQGNNTHIALRHTPSINNFLHTSLGQTL